jgi:LysM repeat protein
MICPFLGQKDDPSTSFSFPSALNFCNLAKPPYPPEIDHQEAYCLAKTYGNCPIYIRQEDGPLPPEIRAPGSKPVWGTNLWKVVLAVLFMLLLVVIGWQFFSQGAISSSLDGYTTASPSEKGVLQSITIFPGLTSTTSKTASSYPTTTPTWNPTLPPTPPTPTRTPASCGAPPTWIIYIVQPGDTLYRLGQIYGIPYTDIQRANCLTSSTIHTGQRFYVPPWAPHMPSPTIPGIPIPTDTPAYILPSDTPWETWTDTPTATASDTAIVETSTPTDTDTAIATPTDTATP